MTAEDAATVLLLSDSPAGIEVFMLERHLDSDFVGGAYVFPGGKVDDEDRRLPASLTVGSAGAALAAAVGQGLARALTVAAIRETFEECGVLLATVDGAPLPSSRLDDPSFLEARGRMTERNSPWDWTPWLEKEHVQLDLDALIWWSWWVTPVGVHRRFDTKFFLARLPEGHAPGHDDVETTDSTWITPAGALEAARAGRATIILPTRKNLEELSRYPSVEGAWMAAGGTGFDRPRIEPTIAVAADGQIEINHPTFIGPEQM